MVTLIKSCGECHQCHDGDPASYHHAWDTSDDVIFDDGGNTILQAMHTAAFAEFVNVDMSQCFKIPSDLPSDVASLLSSGIITGVGAVKTQVV